MRIDSVKGTSRGEVEQVEVWRQQNDEQAIRKREVGRKASSEGKGSWFGSKHSVGKSPGVQNSQPGPRLKPLIREA